MRVHRLDFIGILFLLGIVALIAWSVNHASGADAKAVPGKWYVVATVQDSQKNQVYGTLRYNNAGPFDDKAACDAWLATHDAVFEAANLRLLAQVLKTFGPTTTVEFSCLTRAPKGDSL